MVERIKLFLKVKNLSPSHFADEIGFQRSGLSHIISGRNMPSLDFVQKVLKVYPELSPEWLLRGEGQMFRTSQIGLFDQEELVKEVAKPEKMPVGQKEDPFLSLPEVNMPGKITAEVPALNSQAVEETEKIPVSSVDAAKEHYEAPAQIGSEKKIEKIVILYSDRTFREYFIEQH